MLIIIEGMDKTGKTTLANHLLKNLPMTYLLKHGSKPKDNSEVERQKIKDVHYKILQTYNLQFKDSILIVDRFLLSEFVYCIKRGYEAMTDEDLLEIAHELNGYGPQELLLIYCTTDKNRIKERMITEKEDYAKVEEIDVLLDRYKRSLNILENVQKLTYDYSQTTPEKVARYIQLLLEREAEEDEY